MTAHGTASPWFSTKVPAYRVSIWTGSSWGRGRFPGDSSSSFDQIGTGYTQYLPNAGAGWYGFQGQVDDVQIWNVRDRPLRIAQDRQRGQRDAAGLVADYPFDESQGPTAYDQTANHNDGTLAGFDCDLPTWLIGTGEAIDLGDDGITYNAASPRRARTTCKFPDHRHRG